jgi:hypothetical protein
MHAWIPLPKGRWRTLSWLNENEVVVVIVIEVGDMFLGCFIKTGSILPKTKTNRMGWFYKKLIMYYSNNT